MKHKDASVIIKNSYDNRAEIQRLQGALKRMEERGRTGSLSPTEENMIDGFKSEIEIYQEQLQQARKYNEMVRPILDQIGTPVETKGEFDSSEFKNARKYNGYVFDTSSLPIDVWSMKKFKGLNSIR